MNGTIGKMKEKSEGYSSSVTWVFGATLFIGFVNLLCCTPFYFAAIGYLWARVMGE
jgi:hypothetical protein